MEREAHTHLPGIELDLRQWRRTLVLGGFFLLVWPTFNLLYVSVVLLEIGVFDIEVIGGIALKVYGAFALAYGLTLLCQRLFPQLLSEDRFWPQLALHIGVIFFAAQFFGPISLQPYLSPVPQPKVVPLVFMLFQITLYVAVKTLFVQRDRHLATQLTLRQAQINVLRSQTNPHFLFNTLNLLASEIGRNPDIAREIVYDLADLLRDSMQAAEKEMISLDDEVRLARLYLTLQKKRFSDRLEFDINVDKACLDIPVPSLLLQPLVENVVKHVVARSAGMTSVSLWAHIQDDRLLIGVTDNGPEFDAATLKPRGGLRIVRDTLALHYQGRADLLTDSTRKGGQVKLSLPLQQHTAGGN